MKLAHEFNIVSHKEAISNNQKDLKIARLKSQLHELRLRQKDYSDLNARYVALQGKVDRLC